MMNYLLYFLNTIKTFFESNYSCYFCIAIIVASLFLFIWQMIVAFLSKRVKNCKIYIYFSLLSFLMVLFCCIGGFLLENKIFNSIINLYIFLSITFLSNFIYLFLIKIVYSFKKEKQPIKDFVVFDKESHQKPPSYDKVIEKIKMTEDENTITSGFINVAYVKTLIEKLKEKNLDSQDRLDVENLEVYLLNFINKQPNQMQRQELSIHLGKLIKHLAKYQAV